MGLELWSFKARTGYVMSVIDTARNISLLVKKGVTVELVELLVKLRQEAEALQEENRKLKARVAELEGRAAEVRESLSFDGTVYWGTKDGPQK
jgi:uncharacterized protein YlxW (UPF0749 family)